MGGTSKGVGAFFTLVLSGGSVSVRHLLLAAGAALVAGMCVYLFLQVRATPAVAESRGQATTPQSSKDDVDHEEKPAMADASNRRIPGISGLRSPQKVADSTPEPAVAPSAGDSDKDKLEGPKLDAVMAEANKAYDKQDFEEARAIAQRVLKQHPTNTRMLRIMTSAACIEVDANEAQKWFNLLPQADREQMKTRCTRYGVTFTDPPAK